MHQYLENSLTTSLHDHKRPALPKMIVRGLFRRCAWCGGKGSFFTSWYGKADRCQTCGLAWERGYEGYELGAATMGVFLTFGSIIFWMVLSVIIGVALVPLLVVAGALAIGVPILGYPLTYTVWQGVDLFIRAPSDDDIQAAEAWLAANKG
jgi:uncharacterized protein (DUF983 family)